MNMANGNGRFSKRFCEFGVQSEELEKFMSVLAIDITLLENWKIASLFVLDVGTNVFGGARLLSAKLITGECKDFKTKSLIKFMNLL